MREPKNVKGMKFNRLTAIAEAGRNKFNQKTWLFRCNCGVEIERTYSEVRGGHVKSCGCYLKSEEFRSKLSESLNKKWASGTRKKNPPETYMKSSISLKKGFQNGRKQVVLTHERAMSMCDARDMNKVMAAIKRTTHNKIGVPNPPGPSAASPDHWKAKFWQFKTPNQEVIEGYNLNDLIRKHQHLFEPLDIVFRKHNCKAARGLRSLFDMRRDGERKHSSWKGWMIGDKMKRDDHPD